MEFARISAVLEEADMSGVVQTLITKCMESDDLCNEFFLQLIKQTTDCPPGKNRKLTFQITHVGI